MSEPTKLEKARESPRRSPAGEGRSMKHPLVLTEEEIDRADDLSCCSTETGCDNWADRGICNHSQQMFAHRLLAAQLRKIAANIEWDGPLASTTVSELLRQSADSLEVPDADNDECPECRAGKPPHSHD